MTICKNPALKKSVKQWINLMEDMTSSKDVLDDLTKKINEIEAKYIRPLPQLNLPILDIPDLLDIKVWDKDLKDLNYIYKQSNKAIDLYLDTKQTTAAWVISHYDNAIVDEINVFNSFINDWQSLWNKNTRHWEIINKFLIKSWLSRNAADELEKNMHNNIYSSIRTVRKDWKLVTEFNKWYTIKQLESIDDSEKDIFKSKNKWYLDRVIDNIKWEAESWSLEWFDFNRLEELLDNYRMDVIEPSLWVLDKARSKIWGKALLDTDYFKFKWQSHESFFKDLVNSFTWDPQFVFKYKVFKWKEDKLLTLEWHFKRQYIKNFWIPEESKKAKIYNEIKSDARKVYNSLLDRSESNWLIKFIKNTQWLVYQLKLWMLSWWLAHLSMWAQLASNVMEMSSIFRHITDQDLIEAKRLDERLWWIWEDAYMNGNWFERERLDNTYVAKLWQSILNKWKQWIRTLVDKMPQSTIDKLAKWWWIESKYVKDRIANQVEIYVADPMVLDALQDESRKIAAFYKVSKKFGTSVDEIWENTLRSLVREEYGKLWWAVMSTSPIYRETRFTMLDPSKTWYWIINPMMASFRFLKWWAISKSLSLWEATLNWMKAIEHSAWFWKINNDLANVYYKEFVSHYTHLASAIFDSMSLYAKFEKYNHDNQEKHVNSQAFIEWATNQIVWLQIFAWQELNNLLWFASWDLTAEQQWTKLTYEFLQKATWWLKIAWFPIVMQQHLKMNPWDYEWAVMAARSKLLWGIFRFGKTINDDYLYEWIYSQDPMSLFMVNPRTNEQISIWKWYDEVTKNLDYIEWKKANLWMWIMNLFSSYISPSDFYIQDKKVQSLIQKITQDKWLRWLMNNSATEFNLKSIYDYNPLLIWDLYKNLWYIWQWDLINKDITKKLSSSDRIKWGNISFDLMDKFMTDLYKEWWMTYEWIQNTSDKYSVTEWYAKILHIANTKDPQKVKYILPYLIQKDFKSSVSTFYKSNKRKPTEEEYNYIKLKSIENRLPLFDANNEAKQELIHTYMNTKPEIYEWLDKKLGTNLMYKVNAHLDNMLLQTQNLKESWTNVKYLTSRYRTNLWFMIPKTEQWKEIYAKYVLNSLSTLAKSPIPEKDRVARQAAMLLWMTKEWSDILSDNKKFESLSHDAKVQLANWYYKVHWDMDKYSSETVSNMIWWWKKSSWYKSSYRNSSLYRRNFSKSKSQYWSWQRPWFSKQMPSRIPSSLWPYINANPHSIVHASIRNNPWIHRQLMFSLPRAISKLRLNVMFNSFISGKLFNQMSHTWTYPRKKTLYTNKKKIKYSATHKTKPLKKNRPGKISINPEWASAVEFVK